MVTWENSVMSTQSGKNTVHGSKTTFLSGDVTTLHCTNQTWFNDSSSEWTFYSGHATNNKLANGQATDYDAIFSSNQGYGLSARSSTIPNKRPRVTLINVPFYPHLASALIEIILLLTKTTLLDGRGVGGRMGFLNHPQRRKYLSPRHFVRDWNKFVDFRMKQ